MGLIVGIKCKFERRKGRGEGTEPKIGYFLYTLEVMKMFLFTCVASVQKRFLFV